MGKLYNCRVDVFDGYEIKTEKFSIVTYCSGTKQICNGEKCNYCMGTGNCKHPPSALSVSSNWSSNAYSAKSSCCSKPWTTFRTVSCSNCNNSYIRQDNPNTSMTTYATHYTYCSDYLDTWKPCWLSTDRISSSYDCRQLYYDTNNMILERLYPAALCILCNGTGGKVCEHGIINGHYICEHNEFGYKH